MSGRDDPFGEIEQLFEQFSQFSDPFGGQIPVDVIDTEDELLVRVDLPGRDPEAISVTLEESRQLKIEVGEGDTSAPGRFVTRERSLGSVSRRVSLPAAVDDEQTDANYERGVLTVHLPKLSGDNDGTEIPVN